MANRLALIAPKFFGYYLEMISEAEQLGYKVDYYCDAPSNSNLSKALGRIDKRLIQQSTKRYFQKDVLPKFKSVNYNKVLIVGGMTFSFTPEMVSEIRMNQMDAKMVLYQWDSEKNLPYSTYIHRYFDQVYTFDRFDALEKEIYLFLPLFFTKDYEGLRNIETDCYKYDCMYIGTAHPKKYKEINKMSLDFKKVYPSQFIYHYMPSLLKFIYHKVTAKEYRHASLKEFKRERMSTDRILEVMKNSRCVFDAPQAGQTGLTMRTFECLGANKKLITTNEDVKNYDFFRPTNILVYDGKTVDFTSSFFSKPYEELPQEIYNKYSLRAWINQLLT